MPKVQFATGADQMPGYLALPTSPPPWPGVVVIMDAVGLSEDIRSQADRLASAGYLALAPDLYARGRIRCIKATVQASRTGHGPAYNDIEGARRFLAERDDCSGRIGIIGFCMGGGFALMCAMTGEYSVSSVNYGFVPDDVDSRLADADTCPIVGSFGVRDRMLRGHPQKLDAALTSAGVPHDIKEYDGVGHSFLNKFKVGPLAPLLTVTGFHYDGDVASDAWRRILAYFETYLRTS
jgi:carboxymethylenebutenolidase